MKESDFKQVITAVRNLPTEVCAGLVSDAELRTRPDQLGAALGQRLDKAHPSYRSLMNFLDQVSDKDDPKFVSFLTSLRYRTADQQAKITPICTLSSGSLPGFGRTKNETLQLINDATKSIYVLGYWLTINVDYVIRALEQATNRGVKIIMLADSNENFVEPFMKEWDSEIPFPSIYLFRPSALRAEGNSGAKMHAKTIIVDDERMIITSANLTHLALHENIELGVLIEGRAPVTLVSKMVNALIHDKDLFEKQVSGNR